MSKQNRPNWNSRLLKYARVAAIVALLLLAVYVGSLVAGLQPQGIQPIWQQIGVPPCIVDPANLPPPTRPDGSTANYLHTCGNRLCDSKGREVRITGINWFGAETDTFVPHGLWSRHWESILDQIANLGYNTIRLPYSNEMLRPGIEPRGIDYNINPDLQGLTSLQVMDKIIAGARERGIKVILDRHRPTSAGQSPLWYTDEVSEEQWIADWRMLASRYFGDDTIIAVDLHNEPFAEATWGSGDLANDWALAAERAGNAILEVNPYLLILVQGIEQYQGDWYWWGGNLQGAAQYPVRLTVPSRLVYSPHDYGPEVYPQGWFSDPSFPNNLPQVWDKHWGYISREGIAPILVGEFGGRSVDQQEPEGQWQIALLTFISQQGLHYFNWSLNPNSGDTGGLLSEDWLSLMEGKYDTYKQYLAPPIVDPGVRHFGPAPAQPGVLYRVGEKASRVSTISFSLQITNDGGEPIDLTKIKVRYWFSHGQSRGSKPLADIDWAALGQGTVETQLVPTDRGGQDYYMEISFTQGTSSLPAYGSTGDILVRVHASDWSEYDQSNDYSFDAQAADYVRSDHITLYVDGRLAWGTEP